MRTNAQYALQSTTSLDSPPLDDRSEYIDKQNISQPHKRWDPRSWGWKGWLIAAVVLICIVIAAVVGGVEGSKNNSYPDYTPLNYSIKDTCESRPPNFCHSHADIFQTLAMASGMTTSIISSAMTPLVALCTTAIQVNQNR